MQTHLVDMAIVGYHIAVVAAGSRALKRATRNLDSYSLGGRSLPPLRPSLKMKSLSIPPILASIILITAPETNAASAFQRYVTCRGDKLMDGTRELRFVSFNIPNLHYIEDNLPFQELNHWRLPDAFEITDALTSIKQMGGQVVRIYTLSVRKAEDPPHVPRHVLGPGQFDEVAFRALDKVLQVANETGVRIIIPFVDNWKWWGGVEDYAAFRRKNRDEFWTDPQLIADFKETISYVINRTNSFTGVRYRYDKAILAWETGNELQCPADWTHEIAAYIKSLDPNHLVIDGFHTSVLRDESLDDPAVDIVTTHHYPRNPEKMISQVESNRARAQGRKPYFVGEFGFAETAGVQRFLDTVIESGTSGAFIWSLRFRNRDGGFYWHSEPFGYNVYKGYHWPGFASGDRYDETSLLNLMWQKAFEIQGLPVPKLAAPEAPLLLPIADVAAISWQGSAGAASYDVERRLGHAGDWTVVGRDISDAAVQYRPLFSDTTAQEQEECYYRVRAKNNSGVSPWSNIVGPVTVKDLTLADEMQDYSQVHAFQGTVSLEYRKARTCKEDIHRLKGLKGSYIIYRLPGAIHSWKLFAFLPAEVADFIFALSTDGKQYREATTERKEFYSGENEYGYLKPVLYEARIAEESAKYLKIEFAAEAQISRVEIKYAGKKPMMDTKTIRNFQDRARRELQQDILPFWTARTQDRENGGFIGRMSNNRAVHKDAPKGLVLNARILWTFSAAYRFDAQEDYLQMARRAYNYFRAHFWDDTYKGTYWILDAQGEPLDNQKKLYGQSFAIYALAEYHRASGDASALEKAQELFSTIEERCHDPEYLGYFEMFERDWSRSQEIAIGGSATNDYKSMNAHLHLLEAYTNLYRVWKDDLLGKRLRELIEIFRDKILNPQTYHFQLFFDQKWQPSTRLVSFGHDIEGSWLLWEAAEVLGDEQLSRQIRALSLKMAEAVYAQALDEDGGLMYEAEAGRITDSDKHWWPQAEMVVGLLNAYQLSGDQRYLDAAWQGWLFIEQSLVDGENGEWLYKVSRSGKPDLNMLKVSEWKGPYHNGRACLEIIQRLDRTD